MYGADAPPSKPKQGVCIMPTTGVYSGNDIARENLCDFIDLDYESAVAELEANGADEDELIDAMDCFETGQTQLYGEWITDAEGKYTPDPTGEYAMIYNSNENTAQVVFSSVVRYGRPASPCYPGQVDARTNDPVAPKERCYWAYYALPEWAMHKDE